MVSVYLVYFSQGTVYEYSVMNAVWQLPITPVKAYHKGELPLVKRANKNLQHSWDQLHHLWDIKDYDRFWSMLLNIVDRSIYFRLLYVISNPRLYNMLRDNEAAMISSILNSVEFRIGKVPSRAVLIPKTTLNPDGTPKMRTLEVPTVAARIYLGVFNSLVMEFMEPTISRNQFGFRTGKPGYLAWLEMMRLILYYKANGINFRIYELDLLGFFPNIHKSLLREMYINQLHVPRRLLSRVEAIDSIPLVIEGVYRRSETGLPQGAAPSPLLANLVLNELGLLNELSGGSSIFQYADDCVIIGRADCIVDDVAEYGSRLRNGVSISLEKSKWNTDGILKFIGYTLDLNTGQFTATPHSGNNKDLGNIYVEDINSEQFESKLRQAFVIQDMLISNVTANRREPKFRGITCQQILEIFNRSN
jgi:retron-type reverse transcriptase